MSSPRMITLFTQLSDPGQRPASFALSIVLHTAVAIVVWFSVTYKPPFRKVISEHYTVRELDLRTPDEQLRAVAGMIPYPAAPTAVTTPAAGNRSSAPSHPAPNSDPPKPSPQPKPSVPAPAPAADQPVPEPPAPPQVDKVKPGPQTLIQADLQTSVTLKEEIPVPQVMIWSPSTQPVTKIVPPLPDKQTAANVKPSLAKPNQEINLSDVNLASSDHPATAQPVKPSTTSPVSAPNKQSVQLPPVTASQTAAQPTPAAILSISNLQMRNGTAVLPPVNETAVSKAQGQIAQGRAQTSSGPGGSNAAVTSGKPGPTTAPAANGNGSSTASKQPGTDQKPSSGGNSAASSAQAAQPGPPSASIGGLDPGLKQFGEGQVTQITMPKDGHFGAVVVGNSLDEKYPEIAGVWNGRLAYTAYLHVGLAKSWILQYSLPRSDDPTGGDVIARLDAPWPYNIIRPNLAADAIDADALMVHGFVNQSGRFELLHVVFPDAFPQAEFVIKALQQWQFRPAKQDGQAVKVEILLVIPEEDD